MRGHNGADGYGWMGDTFMNEAGAVESHQWVLISRENLESPDFDKHHALRRADELRAELDAADAAYYAQERLRPRTPKPAQVRRCAVYRFYDMEGRLLYVGKAVDPDARQRQHERRVWWPDVARRQDAWFDTEREALDAEDVAIKTESPLYNKAGVILA